MNQSAFVLHPKDVRATPLPEQLPPETVLWWSIDAEALSAASVDHSFRLLSRSEQERVERFRRSAQRVEAIVSRAALRMILSWYCGVPARRWILEPDAFGRPVVRLPVLRDIPCFNVSHSRGQVHIGVRRGSVVGIDVEYVDEAFDYTQVARSVMRAREMDRLAAVPESLGARAFFSHWVAKEAYVKALGLGLSLDVSSVELLRLDKGEWRLRAVGGCTDTLRNWQIWPDETMSGYVAALVTSSAASLTPLRCIRVKATPEDYCALLEIVASSHQVQGIQGRAIASQYHSAESAARIRSSSS